MHTNIKQSKQYLIKERMSSHIKNVYFYLPVSNLNPRGEEKKLFYLHPISESQ